jgi:uncharacterized protein YbjT (DUF2867 family)
LHIGLFKGRPTFEVVDHLGNKNLMEAAVRFDVRKFVYVSVYGPELFRGLEYVESHERFVEDLKASGLNYCVVRPTGFFSAFRIIVEMASKGRGNLIGSGEMKTNPIHEADLAVVCADAIEGDDKEISIGGPKIYSRREIVELAFSALGRQPKIGKIPAGMARFLAGLIRPFDRRLSAFASFVIRVNEVDVIAPAAGNRTLEEYFDEIAVVVNQSG